MSADAPREVPRDGASTRELILDVAEQLFAKHGFAGVSVRQIAADAGLKNQASLYHHFRNKLALYEAVIERGLAPCIEVIRSGNKLPAGPVLDKLIDHLSERPHLPRLIWRAGLDESNDLRRIVGRLVRPLYDNGYDTLARTALDWDESDLPHLAIGIFQIIFGYFANVNLFAGVFLDDPESPQAIERQRHFLKKAYTKLLGDGGNRLH
jgi:TetR/AcrR family transcriptional regulator